MASRKTFHLTRKSRYVIACRRLFSGVPLVFAERGGDGLQGGGLGGAVGAALVATGVAAAAVWARLFRSRRLSQTPGGKTLRLDYHAEDTRPMLRSGEHRDL